MLFARTPLRAAHHHFPPRPLTTTLLRQSQQSRPLTSFLNGSFRRATLALTLPQYPSVRGMKVRSSVKKLCEGCKARERDSEGLGGGMKGKGGA
ncbi:MAG: hypothetical protein Q9195_005156 [Heterodermia aff. obscurata]